MQIDAVPEDRILNINLGVLGHVDAGKTSLCKALSTHLSTSALDKLPQSQERGITIDLGFSAFFSPAPDHLKAQYDFIQFTLVDCPGHASFIRTVIAGAHIIDRLMLVIDAQKGVQAQTSEALIIGELLSPKSWTDDASPQASSLIVVLNKVDLVLTPPPGTSGKQAEDAIQQGKAQLDKLKQRLRLLLAQTKFGGDVPILEVSANPFSHDTLNVSKVKDRSDSSVSSASSSFQGGQPSVRGEIFFHRSQKFSVPSRI